MTTAERRFTTGTPIADAGAVPAGHPRPAAPAPWSDIDAIPRASRVRTTLTRALVRRALARLPLRARFAGAPDVGKGGP